MLTYIERFKREPNSGIRCREHSSRNQDREVAILRCKLVLQNGSLIFLTGVDD
jgi:hypothetical protein